MPNVIGAVLARPIRPALRPVATFPGSAIVTPPVSDDTPANALTDASGNYLTDADDNYLIWSE